MDTSLKICYLLGHETLWNIKTARKAKTASHYFTESGTELSLCCVKVESFLKFRGPLVSGLQKKGRSGTSAQAGARTSTKVVKVSEAEVDTYTCKGPTIRRLLHQSVDSKADCKGDREAFWGALPPRTCVVADDRVGLELAETRATSYREGRRSHRPVEETRVASNKKKQKDLAPISHFSTKADFYLSPTYARPGRRWGKLRSTDTAISVIRYPPSLVLRSPLRESVWAFTCIFTQPISQQLKCSSFYATFCAICEDMLCLSGMAPLSTEALSSEIFFNDKEGSMYTVSQPMLQNSIPMNLSGPRPTVLCPIAPPRISRNSAHFCAVPSEGLESPNGCYGPASKNLICHFCDINVSIIYTKVNNTTVIIQRRGGAFSCPTRVPRLPCWQSLQQSGRDCALSSET